jgi:hypothetical protein
MKRVFMTPLLALALAGCTSYSEMATRPVSYSATTTKTPKAFADCLLPKLMDTNAASHIVTRGDGLDIVVPVGGGTPQAVMMTFDVMPSGGSTSVQMRHMASLSEFPKQWKQAQSCI